MTFDIVYNSLGRSLSFSLTLNACDDSMLFKHVWIILH